MTVSLPQGSICEWLIDEASVNAGLAYVYRELSYGLPVLFSQNTICSLDSDLPGTYKIPYDKPISDIQWVGGDCFFVSDSLLLYRPPEGEIIPVVQADVPISAFSVMERGILLAVGNVLSFYSFFTLSASSLYIAEGPIRDVVALGEDVFLATGNTLMAIGDKEMVYLFSTESPILSFDLHPGGGVFVATENDVFYANPDRKKSPLFDKGAKDVALIGDDLYVVFHDGSSARVTDVSAFSYGAGSSFLN